MAQKIIYGTVNDDGTKQTGSGFDVESTETGIYLITFSQPFVEPPTVVATLKDWGADNQIIVKEITPNKFKIAIWDLGIKQQSSTNSPELVVTQEKSAFNFIAIGEDS
ncbi:H-type lectin domain-containing protein [Anabaena azotica]|uniref:H-type lectin domain-containing protein n=1 Tax=Anabaena azotica TaxID=197653 RepID=UPI0039A57E13